MVLVVKYLLTGHFAVWRPSKIGGSMTTMAVTARLRGARGSAL
jgi:hypothetical protein